MNLTNTIIRCQQGDQKAFEELYRLYCDSALKTAYLICGQKGIAEEIVQEAFIQCFRAIKGLKKPETFNSWFYKTLIRCGWRVNAKYKKNLPAAVNYESRLNDEDREYRIDHEVETREACAMVRQALDQLNIPQRTVITLFYYDNMSIPEIATVLNCPAGTVKSRLHHAKKILAKKLGNYFTAAEPPDYPYQRKESLSNE